jgi:carbon dioxide concentrating mechanism protein CcmN
LLDVLMFPQSLNFQPINTEQYCTSGDVTIFPGAAIAPGVLLQADVGSRIVIRAGVCIGLGCVIHASHGTITIHDGANLGAGVLLIGNVTIGARACLGTAVTVINSVIDSRAILESGSVVGDRSRRESIDDLINDIPMNADKYVDKTKVETANQTSMRPISSAPIDSNSITPENLVPTPAVLSTPVISTFKYPEEPTLDITAPGIVLDNSGQAWQPCDPNPWDPTNHPPGETTCQITSKPKEATPYNPTLFSSQTTASPYPPYPQTPQGLTETVSTFKYPEPAYQSIAPQVAPETTPASTPVQPEPTAEPKPVYGQDYVNRMLGKLTGR